MFLILGNPRETQQRGAGALCHGPGTHGTLS